MGGRNMYRASEMWLTTLSKSGACFNQRSWMLQGRIAVSRLNFYTTVRMKQSRYQDRRFLFFWGGMGIGLRGDTKSRVTGEFLGLVWSEYC